jgi:hypothetical protein
MTYDEPPPLLPPDQMPAVLTDADLFQAWRALMGDLGFTSRALWLLFLRPDGRVLGPLLQIGDLPDSPHDLDADQLVVLCRELLDGPGEGGSLAMLVSRSGAEPWHVGDRAWARFLTAVGEQVGGRVWPVHRANDRELAAVPPL